MCTSHMTNTHPFLSHFRSCYHFCCMTDTCRHLTEEREVCGVPSNRFHALHSSLAGGLHCRCDGSQRLCGACCTSITKSVQNPVSKLCNGDTCASHAFLYNCALAMISLSQLPKANDRNHTGCDAEDQNNHSTTTARCRNQHLHQSLD